MLKLGICYEYGKGGLTKDTSKAMEWYQKAAEAGIIVAAEWLQDLRRNHS